jgi:hypothetical protein
MGRKAMSKLLGIDEAVLSRSIQKKNVLDKMQDELGEDVFAMTPEELIAASERMKDKLTADEKDAIQEQRTTDQLVLAEMKSLNSNIVKAVLGDREDVLGERGAAAAAKLVGDTRSDVQGAVGNIKQFQEAISGPGFAGFIGATQQFGVAVKETKSLLTDFADVIPYIGDKIAKLIPTFITKLVDETSKLAEIGKSRNKLPVDDGGPASIAANDAVIQFNPQDKFMSIAGGNAMIAGTNAGGNQALANQLSGGGGITDDQINKLANSIAYAMKGVTITTDSLYQANSVNGDRFA